jgi:hypothetical protein
MYSKICIKREEKLPAPAPALAPAPAPSLGSVLWLRLPALCSHLPFNAGVGLGFHPSSGSGSSSGCGSTLPPPPPGPTSPTQGCAMHPTQSALCRATGSPPLLACEQRVSQEALVAVARCSDVPRRSRASAIGASTGVLEPIRTAWHCADCPGGAASAANGSHSAAVRQLRGRYRGWPVSSTGPVAILPRDQGRPLSSVHNRRPRLCAASKRACERLPRQHETAAACGVSATNRQGGRVGLVYIGHAPPVWGCPGPAARPTSACSAE